MGSKILLAPGAFAIQKLLINEEIVEEIKGKNQVDLQNVEEFDNFLNGKNIDNNKLFGICRRNIIWLQISSRFIKFKFSNIFKY